MARNRNNNTPIQKFQQTVKDYFVPLAGGIIILLIIYSFMSKGSDNIKQENLGENQDPTDIVFDSVDTEAYIEYPGDVREKITDATNLYKDETIIVKEGSLRLVTPENNKIHLNKIAEFKLNPDNSYSLFSSDAWLDFAVDGNVSMRYANIVSPAESVISLTQNEAGSTIYVLKGTAKVSNLAGISTMLAKGQKVSVSRQNAAKDDIDLASDKNSIDSYFKSSDWFIANNGQEVLSQADTSSDSIDTSSGSTTDSDNVVGSKNQYVSFTNLSDNMSVSTSTLTVTGEILDQSVGNLTVENIPATINATDKSFEISNIPLTQSTTDLVLKVYDGDRNVAYKGVYTVYTSNPQSTSSESTGDTNTQTSVPETSTPVDSQVFNVDGNDFGFTSPSVTGKYTTSSPEITIRGITTADGISKVEVNGFTLSSFNGSTWRYHAFERFNTLKDGTNQYRVDYYGENNSIVYSDYFTIIKEPSGYSNTNPAVTPIEDEQASQIEEVLEDDSGNSSATEEGQ